MKLLLVTGLLELEQKLVQAVSQDYENLEVTSVEITDGFEHVLVDDFDVLVINRYMDQSDEGTELTRFIRNARVKNKNLHVIVLLAENENDIIQGMVSIGVFDLIISEPNESLHSLCNQIHKAIQIPSRQYDFKQFSKNEQMSVKSDLNESTEAASFSIKLNRKIVVESIFKQVIAIYSPTNSGATTTALNLGIALTESRKCKVLVLGLDMMNPALSYRFKRQPLMNLYQLISAHEKRMPLGEFLEDAVSKIGTLEVISGVFDYNEFYFLKEKNLQNLILSLQKYYDYVILDLNSYVSDKATFMALSEANRIYLVGSPYNHPLKILLEYEKLIKDKIPQCQISGIVINEFSGMCLTSVEIENILGKSPVAYIPQHKVIKSGGDGLIFRRKIRRLYSEFVKEVQK